mgnify:CR=1 FL=1|jgi:hypothetical protein
MDGSDIINLFDESMTSTKIDSDKEKLCNYYSDNILKHNNASLKCDIMVIKLYK